MIKHVHAYTKHVNGRLVTVHGYDQASGKFGRGIPPAKTRQVVADPGVHPLQDYLTRSQRFTHGLSPHALFPAGRLAPVIIWNRNGVKLSNEIFLSSSSQDWADAVQEALDHILLVIRNNPGKTVHEIITRWDVQQALQVAGQAGANAVIENLQANWEAARAPENSVYLVNVIRDMQRNGASFGPRMTRALLANTPDQAQKVLLRDRLRASAAESVLQTRAQTETALNSFRRAGVLSVRWQSHLDDTTCTACRSLHETTTQLGREFNRKLLLDNNIKPYGDIIGPPAHPSCRCYLVPA